MKAAWRRGKLAEACRLWAELYSALELASEAADQENLTAKNLARQSRSQRRVFTTETQSAQSSEDFLIKTLLLRGLGASAVRNRKMFAGNSQVCSAKAAKSLCSMRSLRLTK
jgi:hypothetical protein